MGVKCKWKCSTPCFGCAALALLYTIHAHQLIKTHEPLPISIISASHGVGSACAWPDTLGKSRFPSTLNRMQASANGT